MLEGPFTTATYGELRSVTARVGSIRNQSRPARKYTAEALASIASNDPYRSKNHAAARGEIMADRLDDEFMKPVAVPPKRPPTSAQAAQATGTVMSIAAEASERHATDANGP